MITRFINGKAHAVEFIKEIKQRFIKENTPIKATSQISRVLNRFAVIAGGGELATHYNITGWEQGQAYQGAKNCFNNWLSNQGNYTHSHEHRQAINVVRLFIEQCGLSRFDILGEPSWVTRVIHNRAGIRKQENGKVVYYFFRETFKGEVCKGLNLKTVLTALKIEGHLKHQPNKLTHLSPLLDGNRLSTYAVKSSILK